ncbi:MAG: rhodanese-like domain-containing protein [Syntrophomonas sp.]|nr:rhodanese-like domain-containing protein [Syntrophomonas sp.]
MSKLDFFKAKIEATISPMEYMQALKATPEAFVIVDVRNAPPQAMKQKIAGAKHIPLSQLKERIGEIPKDKTVVVYCWEVWCNMAAKAAIILLENGYDVLELSGGIGAWNTMNFPVEPVV